MPQARSSAQARSQSKQMRRRRPPVSMYTQNLTCGSGGPARGHTRPGRALSPAAAPRSRRKAEAAQIIRFARVCSKPARREAWAARSQLGVRLMLWPPDAAHTPADHAIHRGVFGRTLGLLSRLAPRARIRLARARAPLRQRRATGLPPARPPYAAPRREGFAPLLAQRRTGPRTFANAPFASKAPRGSVGFLRARTPGLYARRARRGFQAWRVVRTPLAPQEHKPRS
eukprot:gnl/Chilomastix_cuspidata/7421.p1 GENE.gnl/Chilomastix_cuspidata/7421~~gnl/Chilomastix_cuspidata/7421.p1  ORF type:complete len:228 (+),score=0.75 gnl/Chilomastix_cuspidata/7421:885-1568(+)